MEKPKTVSKNHSKKTFISFRLVKIR